IDTAYYLIHSMGTGADYRRLDMESAQRFRDSCIKAGVKRIVYLGGLGLPETASKHLLSRIETGEELSARPDDIQTIWIRAGVIIGSGSASFEIMRNLCQKLPVMLTPRWVRTKTQAIGIEEVIDYLEQSIELPHEKNLVVDIGSEKLSFQEMMIKSAKVMGLRRFLIPVPVLSPSLSSYWLILFTPVPYKIASSLVEGLKSETLVQNDNAAIHYPQIKPATFEQSVEHAVAELQENQILSRWCDSTGGVACDVKDFDDPAGAVIRDIRIVPFPPGLSREKIYDSVCSLGGEKGWYKYQRLWRLRGLIDKVSGGYGLGRGRRDRSELRIGDALDFWKVVDLKPGKRLLLYAQMKLPGQAWLEFDIQEDQLVQTAHFIPSGIMGRLYWYSVLPFHSFVFPDLANSIMKEAAR
ncbi:MAG: SDR family oxidoreductase, partial [Desulfobulbaceae bacterium]